MKTQTGTSPTQLHSPFYALLELAFLFKKKKKRGFFNILGTAVHVSHRGM